MTAIRSGRVLVTLVVVLFVAIVLVVSACGGSDETTTTTGAPTTTTAPATTTSVSPDSGAGGSTTTSVSVTFTGEEAAVAEAFVNFFDGTRPIEEKIGLLENGEEYADELEANAASPLAQSSSVAVTAVTITSPTEAAVTYSILIGGQPALPDQMGQAVKEDGVWKVGQQSFLALLALQGGAFPTSTTVP